LTGLPQFADPLWLLAGLLVPFLVWRHHRRESHGSLLASRLPRSTGGAWRLHLPFYFRVIALVALIVALGRPRLGYSWEEATTEGIDIQIVVDTSGSMGAEDFQPKNRLTVAKQVVREFIAKRPGDRIGVTIFGGSALTRSPLTTDRAMLDELVDSIELNTVQDGTAIGVALANAASRLKDSAAKSKIIVLVTDGVNNAGEIDPLSAAAVAKGLGLRVYTIGVGREGRVPVRRPHRHQHDRVTQRERSVAVDHQGIEQFPAGARFGADFLQIAFGHPGVMLQGHAGDRLPLIEIAQAANEHGCRPIPAGPI